jgi:hypothetical protein
MQPLGKSLYCLHCRGGPLSLHVKLVIRVFHKFRDVNVNNTISITSELWHHFWGFFINHAQHFLDAKEEFLELC